MSMRRFGSGVMHAGALERCRQTVAKGFNRLSYTEAIALLQQHISDKKVVFENMDVKWGMDLDSEHEKCARCCPVLQHAVPCRNLLSCVATCCHEIGIEVKTLGLALFGLRAITAAMVVVPWHMPMHGTLKGTKVHSHNSAGSCCASWGGRATH